MPGCHAANQAPRQQPDDIGAATSALQDGGHAKVLKLQALQVHSLLGRRGETANQLRRKSGADIRIQHPPSES
jgi:hypothetical protein